MKVQRIKHIKLVATIINEDGTEEPGFEFSSNVNGAFICFQNADENSIVDKKYIQTPPKTIQAICIGKPMAVLQCLEHAPSGLIQATRGVTDQMQSAKEKFDRSGLDIDQYLEKNIKDQQFEAWLRKNLTTPPEMKPPTV
jgi:hypothetical protein